MAVQKSVEAVQRQAMGVQKQRAAVHKRTTAVRKRRTAVENSPKAVHNCPSAVHKRVMTGRQRSPDSRAPQRTGRPARQPGRSPGSGRTRHACGPRAGTPRPRTSPQRGPNRRAGDGTWVRRTTWSAPMRAASSTSARTSTSRARGLAGRGTTRVQATGAPRQTRAGQAPPRKRRCAQFPTRTPPAPSKRTRVAPHFGEAGPQQCPRRATPCSSCPHVAFTGIASASRVTR